jgi:hypothetical protein
MLRSDAATRSFLLPRRLGALLVGVCWIMLWCVAMGSVMAYPPVLLDTASRDAALRDAIGAHLATISAALREGDADAAVRLLAPREEVEPEFLVEFANFARDTTTKPPAEFAMLPAEPASLWIGWTAQGLLEARLPVRVQWRMAAGAPQREVMFVARVIRVAGAWTYGGESWERVQRRQSEDRTFVPGGGKEVGDVDVLYDDSSLARVALMTLEAYESVHGRIEAGLGAGLASQQPRQAEVPRAMHVQRIKLYSSMAHLQVSIYPSYSAPLSGWNEPGESIKALVTSTSTDAGAARRMRALLAHEYTHVRTFMLGPTANAMPWWALEGIAELGADAEEPGAWGRCDALVKSWAQADRLVDFAELADFATVPQAMYPHVYAQGHHMLGFITTRFGREARNRWLHAMANRATLDEATRRELGLSFRELDSAWRASVTPVAADGAP